MNKMPASRLSKEIIKDINATLSELRAMCFIRDENGISQHPCTGNLFEVSFTGKNDSNGIMYDKHISCAKLMDELLSYRQYTILLYDKSIIQAEFMFDGDAIVKERLVFIKKHNKIWSINEIDEYDAFEEDWFSEEEGIPILIRVDYDPQEHKECEHASSHLTLSNHESCRIPMKQAITFSDFIRFILFHFYDKRLQLKEFRLTGPEDITDAEKKMIHIDWR